MKFFQNGNGNSEVLLNYNYYFHISINVLRESVTKMSIAFGTGMRIATREWEEMGLKNSFPHISTSEMGRGQRCEFSRCKFHSQFHWNFQRKFLDIYTRKRINCHLHSVDMIAPINSEQ